MALPEVLHVEPNYIMRRSSYIAQRPAHWNLATLSSPVMSETLPNHYIYHESAGRGTFSYVLDSGIRLDHHEFGGRAIFGYNAVKGSTTNTDESGHGTAVASVIGGAKFGVAKKTTLVAVKIFGPEDGSTTTSIKGFKWAVDDIVQKNRQKTAVINVSTTSYEAKIWAKAIHSAYKKGVLVVTSAGNNNMDAESQSPCSSVETICVGNVDHWQRAPDSNYGPAVDIFAPGSNILTAGHKSETDLLQVSGTSFSAPLVAGLVSYLRGLEGPSTAVAIKTRVYNLAVKDVVYDTRGSKNLLAYNGVYEIGTSTVGNLQRH